MEVCTFEWLHINNWFNQINMSHEISSRRPVSSRMLLSLFNSRSPQRPATPKPLTMFIDAPKNSLRIICSVRIFSKFLLYGVYVEALDARVKINALNAKMARLSWAHQYGKTPITRTLPMGNESYKLFIIIARSSCYMENWRYTMLCPIHFICVNEVDAHASANAHKLQK